MNKQEIEKMLHLAKKRVISKKKEADKVLADLASLCAEVLSLQKKLEDNGGQGQDQ